MSKRSDANAVDKALRAFEIQQKPEDEARRKLEDAKEARELEKELSFMFKGGKGGRKKS